MSVSTHGTTPGRVYERPPPIIFDSENIKTKPNGKWNDADLGSPNKACGPILEGGAQWALERAEEASP